MDKLAKLQLKKGREKPVLRRHPWIFSGAVDRVLGDPEPGETVAVLDYRGEPLARAAFSPNSQIRARIWTWHPDQKVDADFFRRKLKASVNFRRQLGLNSTALRWVHAESDGLPGLIADQYAQVLVIQLLSAGAEHWKDLLVEQLAALTGVQSVYERSDVEVRKLEGLAPRTGLLYGPEPGSPLEIEEQGIRYRLDIKGGHKTGFYLDQRDNRQIVRSISRGRDVLDCFCYTGGFSLNALVGGADSVVMVDSSPEALGLAEKNLHQNHLDGKPVMLIEGDVFEELRSFRDRGRSFDLIVLDPPKFAPTAKHAQRAARGYKDINLLAFKLLRSGGELVTFSCSGGIDQEFFLRILSGAALDAEVNARIRMKMWQSADHSVNLRYPEGSYLKGFVIRID